MPRPKSTPSYCHHKKSGQAYVTIDGKQIPLGRHGTPESRAAYDRLIAQWLLRGRQGPSRTADLFEHQGPTINDLAAAFLEHARTYYRKSDGQPTGEYHEFRAVIRHLVHFHGQTPIEKFGPKALRAWRDLLTKPLTYTHCMTGKTVQHRGWSRPMANKQTNRVKMIFKWGVSDELVPAAIYQALATVRGLAAGRTDARETQPVKPVAETHVQSIYGQLPRPIEAILKLQLLTGARGGELCIMRAIDIDMSAAVWVYRPATHKTQWHGHEREIMLGKQCQEIIRPFLPTLPYRTDEEAKAYLFSPRLAVQDLRAKRAAARTTPAGQGNEAGSNITEQPQRVAGDHYTSSSYRRAVQRACETAFPLPLELARVKVPARNRKTMKRWETRAEWKARLGPEKWAQLESWIKSHRFHPHQVRHTVATKLRKLYNLETAGVVLGQKSLAVTQGYAEQNRDLGRKVAMEIG